MIRHICIITTMVIAFCVNAQEVIRPVNSAWSAEVGVSQLADTYLSPVKYSGEHYGLSYSRRQAMTLPDFLQGWDVNLSFDNAKNPAGNARMLAMRVQGGWRMMHSWKLPKSFSIGLGGYIGAEFGVLYLSRNGNNPAQADAAFSIGPQVYAQWNSKLGKLPLRIRAEAWSPLIGGFFCPDYGELYYEISLGNHSGLFHFGWPGNRRRVNGLLSVDFDFGKSSLRLGYKFDAVSSKANHITHRRIEHSAVIGVVCDFINLNSQNALHDAQIITAYY
ncbi:MAG: DUF3316 domain-containing protein [Bacteroidales bacterium]|nr:DUF3316 domain-containing protein [Bacteroidales bacterium]